MTGAWPWMATRNVLAFAPDMMWTIMSGLIIGPHTVADSFPKQNTKTCMVNPRGHDGGSWADTAGWGACLCSSMLCCSILCFSCFGYSIPALLNTLGTFLDRSQTIFHSSEHWTKIEHELSDLTKTEHKSNTNWPQIVHQFSDWTQIDHELNTDCNKFFNLTQIEHVLNTYYLI